MTDNATSARPRRSPSLRALDLRPEKDRELAEVRRRADHLEDQLRKSRRWTAFVGMVCALGGMVFHFIISAPPVWIGAL